MVRWCQHSFLDYKGQDSPSHSQFLRIRDGSWLYEVQIYDRVLLAEGIADLESEGSKNHFQLWQFALQLFAALGCRLRFPKVELLQFCQADEVGEASIADLRAV